MENSTSTVFIDSGVRLGFGEQLPSANAPHFLCSIHVSIMQRSEEDGASCSMHAPVELTKLTNDNELQTNTPHQ
jgi:hypothetical protein